MMYFLRQIEFSGNVIFALLNFPKKVEKIEKKSKSVNKPREKLQETVKKCFSDLSR